MIFPARYKTMNAGLHLTELLAIQKWVNNEIASYVRRSDAAGDTSAHADDVVDGFVEDVANGPEYVGKGVLGSLTGQPLNFATVAPGVHMTRACPDACPDAGQDAKPRGFFGRRFLV